MKVQSLKEFTTAAIVKVLQDPMHKAHDALRSQLNKLPSDITNYMVKHIFANAGNRIEALQHVQCRSITEVDSSLFYSENVKRVLELVLQAFPELTTLNCSSPYINSTILQDCFSAFHARKVEQLITESRIEVSNSEVESIGLQQLTQNLKNMTLSTCQKIVCEESIPHIKVPNMLTKINVSNTKITNLNFVPDSIVELDISGCSDIPASEFAHLARLKKLTKLVVYNTNIDRLDNLPESIVELDISRCIMIPPSEFEQLAGLKSLIKLKTTNTNISKLECVPESIVELDISYCTEIPVSGFAQLEHFKLIESLNVCGTNISNLDTIPELVKELNIARCTDIPATAFTLLQSRLKKLLKLDASNTKLTYLADIPESVTNLSILGCVKIEDTHFIGLARLSRLLSLNVDSTNISSLHYLPVSLENLDISWCTNIQESGFARLKQLKNITELKAFNTHIYSSLSIIPEGVETLIFSYPTNEKFVHTVDYLRKRLGKLKTLEINNKKLIEKYRFT